MSSKTSVPSGLDHSSLILSDKLINSSLWSDLSESSVSSLSSGVLGSKLVGKGELGLLGVSEGSGSSIIEEESSPSEVSSGNLCNVGSLSLHGTRHVQLVALVFLVHHLEDLSAASCGFVSGLTSFWTEVGPGPLLSWVLATVPPGKSSVFVSFVVVRGEAVFSGLDESSLECDSLVSLGLAVELSEGSVFTLHNSLAELVSEDES